MNATRTPGIFSFIAELIRKRCRNCNRPLDNAACSIPGTGRFCDRTCFEDWIDASVW